MMQGIEGITFEKGERQLWSARPGAFLYVAPRVPVAVYGGFMLWGAVAIGEVNPAAADMGFMLFLKALAWWFILTPLMAYVRAKWLSRYVLTNRRLLWVVTAPRRRVYEMPLDGINFVNVVKVMPSGTGTVRVHGAGAKRPMFELVSDAQQGTAWLLTGVENPQKVAALIESVAPLLKTKSEQTAPDFNDEVAQDENMLANRRVLEQRRPPGAYNSVRPKQGQPTGNASPVWRRKR